MTILYITRRLYRRKIIKNYTSDRTSSEFKIAALRTRRYLYILFRKVNYEYILVRHIFNFLLHFTDLHNKAAVSTIRKYTLHFTF